MSELTPALFERVPRGLFGPLGDPYAELYWELLAELYRHEFEREPFVVTRPTAIDARSGCARAGSRCAVFVFTLTFSRNTLPGGCAACFERIFHSHAIPGTAAVL